MENRELDDDGFKDFFERYVPHLEKVVLDHQSESDDLDDPTIDLNTMDLAIHTGATRGPQQSNNSQISNPGSNDSSLEELEVLVQTLKNKNNYSKKLISIMIAGLERTMGTYNYQCLLRGQLPKTWVPIVKTNNRNCPYIEFIMKSDEADEPPDSQLNNFTSKHMAFGQYVLDILAQTARSNAKSTSMPAIYSTPKKNHQAPPAPLGNHNNKTKQASSSVDGRRVKPRISLTTTSKSLHTNHDDDVDPLNDSKRIQPPRACRTSFSNRTAWRQ